MLGEKFPLSDILNGKICKGRKAEKRELKRNILRFINYSEEVSSGRKGWHEKGFPPLFCHAQNVLSCMSVLKFLNFSNFLLELYMTEFLITVRWPCLHSQHFGMGSTQGITWHSLPVD